MNVVGKGILSQTELILMIMFIHIHINTVILCKLMISGIRIETSSNQIIHLMKHHTNNFDTYTTYNDQNIKASITRY